MGETRGGAHSVRRVAYGARWKGPTFNYSNGFCVIYGFVLVRVRVRWKAKEEEQEITGLILSSPGTSLHWPLAKKSKNADSLGIFLIISFWET